MVEPKNEHWRNNREDICELASCRVLLAAHGSWSSVRFTCRAFVSSIRLKHWLPSLLILLFYWVIDTLLISQIDGYISNKSIISLHLHKWISDNTQYVLLNAIQFVSIRFQIPQLTLNSSNNTNLITGYAYLKIV